jgi:serine protease Do
MKSLRMTLVLLLAIGGANAALAQRQVDIARSKSGLTLKSVFKPAIAAANRSTVIINAEERAVRRQVALGTIISTDGYVLTKGSEVMGATKVFVSLHGRNGPQDHEAKVVGYSEQQDLAMLKIDPPPGVELAPLNFANTTPAVPDPPVAGADGRGRGRGFGGAGRFGGRGRGGPLIMPTPLTQPAPPPGAVGVEVGEWVASANAGATFGPSEAGEEPAAVGVVSVGRRRIAPRNGFLGVSMADAGDNAGTRIMQVMPDSAAEQAGIKVDDVVTSINGRPTATLLQMRGVITSYRAGDVVRIAITRGDRNLVLRATLGVPTLEGGDESPMQVLTGGPVSPRASDFPAVYQHDTIVAPNQCGGPIVDLDGHALGINIARAGRTETYALPADLILPLIEPLKSGKLAPVNANEPNGVKTGEKAATQPSKGE